MSMDIKTASPEEAALYLKRAQANREMNFPFGISIKGTYEIKCREIESGEVVWEHTAENVVTDYGRRRWFDEGISTAYIVTHPSTEAPDFRRFALIGPYDGSQIPISSALSGVWSWSTYQKTWGTYTFPAPGALRYIGTVGLTTGPAGVDFFTGLQNLVSYLLLSPAKTQTTSQQLEVVYKLSFTPNI